jgi:Zn-dependent metalloprotease
MIPTARGTLAALTAVFLVSLVLAGTAAAFQPTETTGWEIPLREFDVAGYRSAVTDAAGATATAALSQSLGGDWKVWSWNSQAGTPHYIYGTGAQVAPHFGTADEAVAKALDLVAANPTVFRADASNLRLDAAPRGAGKQAVHFQQTYHGLDVYGGRVSLTFTEGGRLFVIGSDYYDGIAVNPSPSIPAGAALDIARRSLSPATTTVEPTEPKLMVLPVPLSETMVDFRLVWQVRIRTEEPVGIWVTSVDAHTGEIVWRYNDVSFVNFTGTTHGLVERPSYCEGQTNEPFGYLRIQVSGQPAVYADVNGNWTVPYSGTDTRSVTCDLYSPYVDLNNMAGAEGTFTGNATPGTPLNVAFTDANSQKDEKTVYQSVNDIHTWYQAIDPAFAYANARITANVSINTTCNAYWDGTINFYVAGGGCANTGEIMGVVQHEFCHGITNAIIGSQGSQGIGEGNSDVLSNYLTHDPIIGRGFYLNNCTSGIRNSLNNLQYPADVIGQEIHAAGQVIAGFQWDAWIVLESQFPPGQALDIAAKDWHFGRVLQHPTTQPDQVLANFVADDDDGNLGNGTPHYDALCTGATNHGFSCPTILVGVFIIHEPLSSRTTPGDATVVATITSTEGALVPSSLLTHYRIGGGPFVNLTMTATGNPNEYTATIPGLPQGSEVEYYLSAAGVLGNTKTSPESAPASLWAFDVCNVLDQLEADSGWTVNAEGGDNATSGIWTRVDPIGTTYNSAQIQTENDRTAAPGVLCWVTGQGSQGGAAGEQDVDGGATTLFSPTYDLTGSTSAKVKYYRWYTDDKGVNAGDDSWVVQVRNNGGAWQNAENTGEEANYWKQITIDLYALFGANLGTVQFKFIASDTGANSLLEAAVDDFEILNSSIDAVPDWSDGAARFVLLGARPNPARNGAEIGFAIPARADVRIGVYDVSGREVTVLADRSFDGGTHLVSWDGRDAGGHSAASGIYYLRMQTAGFSSTRTMVLTR